MVHMALSFSAGEISYYGLLDYDSCLSFGIPPFRRNLLLPSSW